jgi:peptidyl-prolyl cis-trans isomerase D
LKERAAPRVADIANRFEDKRAADVPFADAAKAAGVASHRATIDQKGMTPQGAKADVPAAPEFLQQAFATDSGNDSDLFEDQNHVQYAVRVIAVHPPALKPLDSVRAQVRDSLIAERRAKMLSERAQALAAQAQREGGLAGAARAINKSTATSAPLTRGGANDVFSADAITKLFSSPPGTVEYARAGKGDGYVIARVAKVIHPQPDAAQLVALRGEISQQLARDLGDTLAKAARNDAGVEIHEQAVKSVLGEPQ